MAFSFRVYTEPIDQDRALLGIIIYRFVLILRAASGQTDIGAAAAAAAGELCILLKIHTLRERCHFRFGAAFRCDVTSFMGF